jgi:hypothetical protein
MGNWKALTCVIEHRLSLISLFVTVGLAGCGGSPFTSTPSTSTTSTPPNPVPSVTSLSPASGITGSAPFKLKVNGNNFVSSSVVQWNGSKRTTSYVSTTQLTAAINAADIATAGNAKVTVVNPAPGGGTSRAVIFTMNNPLTPQPPTIGNGFGAAAIPLNASTSLTFYIKNPDETVALAGVGFSDTLPAGLVVANPNGVAGSCSGGIITAVTGSSSVSLSGATLAGSASCTFSLNVTGTSAGVKNNVTSAVTSNEGSGAAASASVTVVAAPTIAILFGAATIALNASTSLTFQINNPNGTVSLSGIGFNDTLPNGLVVAAPSGLTSGCGAGTITAVGGSASISLSSATLAAGASCTFTVNVTGISAGIQNNLTSAVTSNGGSGGSASASVIVVAPPTIAKLFGAATIPSNSSTSLTFNVNNPNGTVALSGIGFTDPLPSGLVVSTPNGLNGSCGAGTTTAVAGSTSVTLSGAILGAAANCTFTVNVTSTNAGVENNTTSVVTSTQGGNGEPASDSITVLAPPVISKAFGADSIPLASSTSLSFTITNPNTTVALTGVGVIDTLPSGVVVASPNGFTGSCGGGTITAVAGSSSVTLSSATLAEDASCTFAVIVTGSTVGSQVNTTNVVTSSNGGNGNTATATLVVLAPSLVSYFSDANTSGAPDETLRITNPGTAGGDLCADIFVFDANQEISECCSCITTPDNLLTLSVNTDLTANPVTGEVLTSGMVTIVPAATQAGACPLPTVVTPEPSLQSWSTHIQSGSGFPMTETEGQAAGLSAQSLTTLQRECGAIGGVGSGRGICANSAALAAMCNN